MEAFSLLHTWPAPSARDPFLSTSILFTLQFHHAVRFTYLPTSAFLYILGTYQPTCSTLAVRGSHISPHPPLSLSSFSPFLFLTSTSSSVSVNTTFRCFHTCSPFPRPSLRHVSNFLKPARKAVAGGQRCKHMARDYTVSTTPVRVGQCGNVDLISDQRLHAATYACRYPSTPPPTNCCGSPPRLHTTECTDLPSPHVCLASAINQPAIPASYSHQSSAAK